MIDSKRFAKPAVTAGGGRSFFRFAIDPNSSAAALRELADAIELGKLLVQRIQTGQVAAADDFYQQAIMIEFAEREEVEKSKAVFDKDLIMQMAETNPWR